MRAGIVMPLANQRGGGELMLTQLVREAGNGGVRWSVLFLEEGPLSAELADLGADVAVLPSGRLRQAHRFIATVGRIARFARERKLDVLIGWMGKGQLYAGPAAVLARVPSLWYQLGAPYDPGAIDRLATLLPARGILTVSQAGADAQARIRPRRPIVAVYPGVDLESFDPGRRPSAREARKRLDLPAEGPLIGMFGRLQRWKGMHTLVEGMPRVLARHPGAHAAIVGGAHALEPAYEDELRDRIARFDLRERIIMSGHQADVPAWMQAMDVIVHASDFEPFGIVIIEAMALGKPVVAGDAGGPREIVQDGLSGLLVPFDDPEALANAVLRYLDDPDYARRVAHAARARAHEFSTRRYAGEFVRATAELATRD
jgi:glycosyltransferase involved in cell wall biosynthesis